MWSGRAARRRLPLVACALLLAGSVGAQEVEVAIKVRNAKGKLIPALVTVTPNVEKGPWLPYVLGDGAGNIKCTHMTTWVIVSAKDHYSLSGATRQCSMSELQMIFKFQVAGGPNSTASEKLEASPHKR